MSKVIYIPKDLTAAPGALIDPVTGTIIIEYPLELQATDSGCINTNQLILLHKPFVQGSPAEFPTIWQWDGITSFTQVGIFDKKYDQLSGVRCVGTNFWIVGTENGGSTNTPGFHKHDQNGVFILSKGPVPFIVNGVPTFCINDSETIATYANGFFNGPIKTWNLTTNTAGTDIVTNIGANFSISELWAITGSTDIIAVLTDYSGITPTRWILRRYSQAGAIVYETIVDTDTTVLTDNTSESGMDPDFLTVWIRWAGPPNYNSFLGSSFRQFRISDGVALGSQINVPVDGNNSPPSTCPVIVLSTVTPPPPPNPGSGIYKIVPGKHNDTLYTNDLTSSFDVKIPNPFGKTGLIGE